MPRRSTQRFRSQAVGDLSRQLLYAPPGRRIEAFVRAEHLHDEIESEQNYPLEFVVFRVTGRRVPNPDAITLVGEALLPDLRLLIDALSRSVEVSVGDDEPVETTEQLAQRLGVSTKTIARWRRVGLRWRWVALDEGGRRRVVFPRSAVDRFRERQGERVDKASAFSRLPEAQRARLLERARRLAGACDASLNQVAGHLAKRTGRGQETIRQLLEKHELEHPGDPMFGDRSAPLSARQREVIGRAYRRGVRVSKMCQRFGRTRSTIYRAVRESQARVLRAIKLSYIPLPIFDRPDADEVILRPIADQPATQKRPPAATLLGLPGSLIVLYDQPMIDDQALQHLLVRYNYLKYRASLACEAMRDREPRAGEIDRAGLLIKRADAARSRVLRAGLPMVLSVVRRHTDLESGARPGGVVALLDQGNDHLLELVETYHPGKPTRFTSALTNRLLRAFASYSENQAGIDDQVEELAGRIVKRIEPWIDQAGRAS
ncbi:MAG: hypothetical protein AAGC44_10715 [Planctomycetota bacterium]